MIDKERLFRDAKRFNERMEKNLFLGERVYFGLRELVNEEVIDRVQSALPRGYRIYGGDIEPDFQNSVQALRPFSLSLRVKYNGKLMLFSDPKLMALKKIMVPKLIKIAEDYSSFKSIDIDGESIRQR